MGEACSANGERWNTFRLLVGYPEGNRPLGRRRHGRVDNMKMDPVEKGLAKLDWIDLAQDKEQWLSLVKTVMNFQVPYNVGKLLSSCTSGDLSRRSWLPRVRQLIR
jgi:hypothetical protein